MANPEHLKILKKGVEVWNRWREEEPGVLPDLRGAYLIGADLSELNLSEASLSEAYLYRTDLSVTDLNRTDLREADLRKADLMGADLHKADLSEANLSEANLSVADFSESKLRDTDIRKAYLHRADLMGADLHKADLSEANLSEANLSVTNLSESKLRETNLIGADFRNAVCRLTVFANVDLCETKNLDTIHHSGPSTIGIDTLYKSKGNISEVFLRGCGVPDQMIEYAKSLTGSPIQYYSCFISYSNKDEEFAKRVHNDLQAAGVRCWFAPHDIQAGKKIHHQIDDAIRVYDKLLLILSHNSMSSNWVGSEIIRAKKKEDRQGSQMLFPVSIVPYDKITDWEFFDSDTGRDLAREIREYFIPDFSLWKKDHDTYSMAFERLLRDLKAESG